MIINTTLDLFKYGTPPKKSELTDKELQDHLIKRPTKKQHQDAFSMGRSLLKVPEAEKNRMAQQWMEGGGRDPKGRSLDEEIKLGKEEWLKKQKEEKLADKKLIKWALEESPEPIVKNPYLKKAIAAQQDAKHPKKIKPTEPVKIDFNLTPMHTASLMSNIRDSSIYKLLKNPKVIGVDLGHDAIIEAINVLQSSGLLKEGGKVK